MTDIQIKDMLKHETKKAMKDNGISVYLKDVLLLEYGTGNAGIDYIMFEDLRTNTQYQLYKDWHNYSENHKTPWNVEIYTDAPTVFAV